MGQDPLIPFLESIHEKNQLSPVYRDLIAGPPARAIPFFGNIQTAQLITVGVNPSVTEFAPRRQWSQIDSTKKHRNRLMGYFRIKEVPPHSWFCPWLTCAKNLGIPYDAGAAAHLDVCPYATRKPMSKHENADRDSFRLLCEDTVHHFFSAIRYATKCRLLIVAGTILDAEAGRGELISQFLLTRAKKFHFNWANGNDSIAGTKFSRLKFGDHIDIPIFNIGFGPSAGKNEQLIAHVMERNNTLLKVMKDGLDPAVDPPF